jgi:hypothetical protein
MPPYSSPAGGEDPSFTDVWKGNSVCQNKDSPCRDEASVYYVSKGPEPNSFQMKMNKMVHGTEVTMGTVSCKAADGNTAQYTCRLTTFQHGRGASVRVPSMETCSIEGNSTVRFT